MSFDQYYPDGEGSYHAEVFGFDYTSFDEYNEGLTDVAHTGIDRGSEPGPSTATQAPQKRHAPVEDFEDSGPSSRRRRQRTDTDEPPIINEHRDGGEGEGEGEAEGEAESEGEDDGAPDISSVPRTRRLGKRPVPPAENNGGHDQQAASSDHPRAIMNRRKKAPPPGHMETEEEMKNRIRRETDRVKRVERWRREEAGMHSDNICDFCKTHPGGMAAHRERPCNFYWSDDLTIECQNCADFRSQNPGPAEKCRVATKNMVYKRYGANDPVVPSIPACDECIECGYENTCDVDAFLGIACRHCESSTCLVNGTVQRPRVEDRIKEERPWYRHACERCSVGPKKVKDDEKCTWLTDRTTWDTGCTRCIQDNTGCLRSGHLIREPDSSKIKPPSTWALPPSKEMEAGTTELKAKTAWRKICKHCSEFMGQNVCRVPFTNIWSACTRCTQIGIDCVNEIGGEKGDEDEDTDEDEEPRERLYPIQDLSRVGFGRNLSFEICTQCWIHKRPCDRQRPCDSCTKVKKQRKRSKDKGGPSELGGKKDYECDDFDKKKGRTKTLHNCMIRSKKNLGPLYYLALGYGPGGVDTVKTGSNPYDWIGPMVPKYGSLNMRKDGTVPKPYAEVISTEAARLRPQGAPPHGCLNGSLENARPSQLTGEILDGILSRQGIVGGPNMSWRYEQVVKLMISPNWPRGWEGVTIEPASILAASPRTKQGARARAAAARTLPAPQSSGVPETSGVPQSGSAPAPPAQPLDPQIDQMVRAAAVANQLGPPGQAGPINPFYNYALEVAAAYDGQRGVDTQGGVESSASMWSGGPGNGNALQPWLQPQTQAQTQTTHMQEGKQTREERGEQTHASTRQLGKQKLGNQELSGYNNQQPPSQETTFEQYRNLFGGDNDAIFNHLFPPTEEDRLSSFNTFISADKILLPQLRKFLQSSSSSSRWEPSNHLKDVSMNHWKEVPLQGEEIPPQPGPFRVFNFSASTLIPDNPSRDINADFDLQSSANGPNVSTCMEPLQHGGLGVCGKPVADQVGCRSLTHRQNNPTHFLVCKDCQEESAQVLVKPEGKPITRSEILSMRAYACDECATLIINDDNVASSLPNDGSRRIWGMLNGHAVPGIIHNTSQDLGPGSIAYEARAMPATGCACATKLLDQPLCRFHRLYCADRAMRQVALMNEFRMLRFHAPVCPRCLSCKGSILSNMSADCEGFVNTNGRPTAWVCLACNDWVVNQRNDSNNKAQLVPGELGSLDVNQWFPETDASKGAQDV